MRCSCSVLCLVLVGLLAACSSSAGTAERWPATAGAPSEGWGGCPGAISAAGGPSEVVVGEVAPGGVAPGDAGEGALAPWAATSSCGDGLCVHPESCQSCPLDCGDCSRLLELYFTQPSPDADLARQDSRIGILEATLLGDLLAARRTIDIAVYDLTRPSIAAALREAAQGGVDVRVFVECENRFGRAADILDGLTDAGVQVRDDGSSFGGSVAGCPASRGGRMHHKFAVVDSRTVWVGSMNFTWTGLGYNDNAMLRIKSAALAQVFLAEHGFLWNGGQSAPLHRSAPVRLRVGGTNVEVAFSGALSAGGPEEATGSATRQLVLDAIDSAQNRIDFAAFYLTDERVADALGAKNLAITGVVDASGGADRSSRYGQLCELGLPLTLENRPGKVHHKLLVADGGFGHGNLVIGSANFSQSGFETNDEAVVRVFDSSLAQQASFELGLLRESPENRDSICVVRSAETPTPKSPLCGGIPCVCRDGLDNDHDGRVDDRDSDCAPPR